MKRTLAAIALALVCSFANAQTDSLSAKFAPLDSLLNQFYCALEMEGIEEKCHEADFLIGAAQDSLTRQHIALNIFDHYRDSKLMGDDSVAIYVYDNWFNGKVDFEGDLAALDAEVFVKFNRYCQIDSTAVPVALYKPCGGTRTIPENDRMSVLFFFDTHCSKCILESKILPDVLKDVNFPIYFYAVYSGTDKASWKQWRRKFKVSNRKVKVVHLWDPELDSSYQLYYGVYGTPRMFFVDSDGTILGKHLEVENLKMILSLVGALHG